MARIPERTFDPAKPLFARKAFTAAGRKFTPGAAFDWHHMAVAQRRVRQMFEAGMLMHEVTEPKVTKPKVEAPKVEAEAPKVEVTGDDLDQIDDMKKLREIADEIDAPYKVSKSDQRDAIRERRKEL